MGNFFCHTELCKDKIDNKLKEITPAVFLSGSDFFKLLKPRQILFT